MKQHWFSLFTGSVLAISVLTSCGPGTSSQETVMETPVAEVGADQAQSEIAQNPEDIPDDNPAQRSQLIKRATLSLRVNSIDESFEQIREIITIQQGDLLSLNDVGESQRSLTAELRVPADRLDATLDAITEVGAVLDRSLTTEDVSNQLVDLQARLSNARQSEEALKQLMDRSGNISDVLEVSRELSAVRQSIEQMAAVQKRLQTQVSYSTIRVSLQSATASTPEQPTTASQLTNAWRTATYSVGTFTTDLLQLGLWLLAYSPYLAVLLCGAAVARKIARRSARNSNQQ